MDLKNAEFSMGLIATIFSLVMVFISTLLSPGFSWTGNYLSDIGGGKFGILAQSVFNFTLIIGGIMFIIFSVILSINTRSKSALFLSSLIILLSSISFTLIGIFIEGSPLHYYVSMGFFLLLPVGIIVASAHYYRKRLSFSLFSIFMAIISIAVIMELPLGIGKAIPEYMEAFLLSAWLIIFVTMRKMEKI